MALALGPLLLLCKYSKGGGMLGIINNCGEAFVRENFGDAAWDAVVEKAEIADKTYISTCPYADADTYGIVVSAAGLVGVSVAQALELFGEFFVKYITREGHGPLLKSLGQNIWEMLANLNSLHLHLQLVFRAMEAPSFRCQEITSTSLQLHYYSRRPLLGPLVKGIVQASARMCFNHEVQISLLHGRDTDNWDHEVFLVEYPHQISIARALNPSEDHKFTLSPLEFTSLFPFHILMDTDCRAVQVGSVFSRVVPGLAEPRMKVSACLKLTHPHGLTFCYDDIMLETATTFVFRDPKTSSDFKGSVVSTELPASAGGGPGLLFLGTPRVDSLASLKRCANFAQFSSGRRANLYLSDLSQHDLGRDYVLLAEQQLVDSELRERSERLALEMKELAKNLAAEKELLREATMQLQKEREMSDSLLHQMLPSKVAQTLRSGGKVAARDYSSTTVLFSDIVGFSTISRTCSPRMVCEMLDELYIRFDAVMELPEFQPCYKVETIGDAYMIVCGITEPCEDHAEMVLKVALELVKAAQLVHVNGNPLTIRVVGKRMPRFCLFGDTVNTASRMESHGVPGAVHLSARTFALIRNKELFEMESRGDIEVKGLGSMTTYICRGCVSPSPLSEALLSPSQMVALAEVVNVHRRGSTGHLISPAVFGDIPEAMTHVSVSASARTSISDLPRDIGTSVHGSGLHSVQSGENADDTLQTYALTHADRDRRPKRPSELGVLNYLPGILGGTSSSKKF